MLSRSGEEVYIDELTGQECFCGRKKKRNQTFCPKCYYALPEDMRMKLYRRIGEGYEDAVDRAKEHLR